jgi:hypothetical protein
VLNRARCVNAKPVLFLADPMNGAARDPRRVI